MRRRALAAVIAITACIAVTVGVAAHRTSRSATPTVKVTHDSFRARVTAGGTLEPERSSPLTAPVQVQRPMTIAWNVDEGTSVAAGDVVARLDPTSLQEQRENGPTERRIADHKITAACWRRCSNSPVR